jgi:hypothetical protein
MRVVASKYGLPLVLAFLVFMAQPIWAAIATPSEQPDKPVGLATHREANKIQVNPDGKQQARVACFCLTADDQILAGCSGTPGEIHVLSTDGKLLNTWTIPVNPEAIFARGDGAIFVAGDGQLLKLSSTGSVELAKQGPQADALNQNPQKLREEVVTQFKERAEQFAEQTKSYDKMIEKADSEIQKIDEQLSALKESSSDDVKDAAKNRANARRASSNQRMLDQRRAMYTRQKEQYEQVKKQFAEALGGTTTGELTEAQIDEQVKASKVYKLKASSISALDGDVFLATHATFGYGFEVWRLDEKFENADCIIKDLSGCCGQMDVKACKDGLFVAENSKHRVCHFDRDGKSIGAWGESARTGLEGFGSCCNPMNVAFGPDDAVYTAEDDTGRIKRYSADGKLLGLVGAVELKPGCKNCSISVSKDGNQVYMLDITRNFIVRLDTRPADEIATEAEKVKNAPPAAQEKSANGGSIFEGIQAIFSPGS